MNLTDRNKQAIRSILSHGQPVSYPQIALQGGEGLWGALQELIEAREVERVQEHSRAEVRYKLTK